MAYTLLRDSFILKNDCGFLCFVSALAERKIAMTYQSKTTFLSSTLPHRSTTFKMGLAAASCMLLMLLLSACQNTLLPTSLSVATSNAPQNTSVNAAPMQFPVKVYFSKFPDSLNN